MSTTTNSGESTEALNGKLNFEQSKNRIVGRDADNLIRMLILADGVNFVLKIAPEGVDATTASDDELIFNSDQNIFKIAASDTVTINANSATAGTPKVATIAHGLSAAPMALVALYDGSHYRQLPTWVTALNPSGGNILFGDYSFFHTDSTNLYIYMVFGSNGNYGNFTFKYYLLQESAS